MVDPWNEFVRYKPGVTIGDEVTLPNQSGIERRVRIPPHARILGTLTPDDMTELAIDLATAQNLLKHPPTDPNANVVGLINRAFNPQNRSTVFDPLVSPFIPQAVDGLTGFDLGLRTEEQATLAVEITVDVTDLAGNRAIPSGQAGTQYPIPGRVLSPPGAHLLN